MKDFGKLAPLKKGRMPSFPGLLTVLGPGVVWLALAQGSAELIWWPYLVAKYGLAFLFLLIPACLLQYPLNYEIGSYTLLTGEGIFQGFIRLNPVFAFLLWIFMTTSFLWFGGFASAGGTALAALTDFPAGWSDRAQTLFWAYSAIAIFLLGLLFSKVIYKLIERIMWGVTMITVVGLFFACLHPEVVASLKSFLRGIFIPTLPPPRPWDPQDATKLLTAITFAGLGGFWTLFYSYWLREKGVGMAQGMGHITGPITGKREVIPDVGFTFEGSPKERKALTLWRRFLMIDTGIGVFGNILTTLMTCLLAYVLLFPKGLLPEKYEIAVIQARFFEVSWGALGKVTFLFIAACFLADTWLATLDAVARIHTDCVYHFFPKARKWNFQAWYYFFVVVLTVITTVTMLFSEPGPLILLSALIGFVGTVTFSFAILLLNHRLLPTMVPKDLIPGRWAFFGLLLSSVVYALLALLYFYTVL